MFQPAKSFNIKGNGRAVILQNVTTEKHYLQLEKLALFMGVDKIEFNELGDGEEYTLTKNGKNIRLKVNGGILEIL